MVTNFKENISILSVLKNNLYLNGLFVSDELYRLLNSSTYYGYRTTTGVLMKLGGTLSKKEFMEVKDKNNISLLCDFSEMPFEEYLKYREYTTVAIKKASSINKNALKNSTYFMLEKDQNGKLYIIGQYVTQKQIFQIKFEDCGFFKQDNYKDEAVVLQAGGIRLRDSICGDNCISGCTFCDFGKGADKYIYNFLNTERKEYIIDLIKQSSHNSNVKTLFVTGGNPSLTDLNRWTDFLKESINTFKECVPNGCIDVMLTPRGFDKYVYNKTTRYKEYKKYLEYLKIIGVNTISPNMELWNQEDLNKYCSISCSGVNVGATKSEIGHSGYLDFIKAGIEVFGKYNVRTSLIVGLNSNEDIRNAIKDLIPLGCYVVLLPFKAPNEYFKTKEPSDYDLIELSNYLKYETDKTLCSLPIDLSQTYNERISNSLNAHNSHNTANLCCGQNLDVLEQQILSLGEDFHIVSCIMNNDILNK